MSSRLRKIEKKEVIRVDRITKKIITEMDFGSVVEVYNAPIGLTIHIEKLYEIKEYGAKKVIFDLKKYVVRDAGIKTYSDYDFNEIILDDADIVKKYVSTLHEARRSREVLYTKLLIKKNISVGDVVKASSYRRQGYYVVLPFLETQADNIFINCQKLDINNRLTDTTYRFGIDHIKRIKSIKVRK